MRGGIGQQLLTTTEKLMCSDENVSLLKLLFFEIYQRSLAWRECHILKHVIHRGPWSGFLYYNLTTPPSIANKGRAERPFGFEPWEYGRITFVPYRQME